MISLADKLLACGNSRPATPTFFVGLSKTGVHVGASGVASDSAGGYAIVGGISDTPSAVFVAVFDDSGALRWQRKLSFTSALSSPNVCFDASGNLYVAAGDNETYKSAYLIKYNSAGVLQWQRKLSLASYNVQGISYWNSIKVSNEGAIYWLSHVIDATTYPVVAKYDSSGALAWQRKITNGSTANIACSLDTDPSGSVLVRYGFGPLSNYQSAVMKLNNAGAYSAVGKLGNCPWTSARSMACDSAGNVYLSAPDLATNTPRIIKLNSSLVFQSAKTVDDTVGNFNYGMALIGDAPVAIGDGSTFSYARFSAALALNALRKITSSAGAFTPLCLANDPKWLIAGGQGRISQASYNDAALIKLDPGDDLGAYPPMAVTDYADTASAGTTPGAGSDNSTSSASALTEAAGGLTDAAGTLTITRYAKD
jgi:hypothetical protein